jgi:hypothetical protein
MITTATAAFVLEEDSQQQFLGSSILCEPTYRETEAKFTVRLNVLDSVSNNVIAYGYMEVTKTEVDAETGGGTGETDPWWNALQKAVKTKLAAIPDNSSVTFNVV